MSNNGPPRPGLCPTREELALMSPEEIRANNVVAEELVFGVNFKRDRSGRPIENGIGSPGHESIHHREELERAAARKKLLAALPG
jgi:hypothetical protein